MQTSSQGQPHSPHGLAQGRSNHDGIHMAQQRRAYAPRGTNGMQSVQQGVPIPFLSIANAARSQAPSRPPPPTTAHTILSNLAYAGLTEIDLEKGYEEQHRWARTSMPDLYPRTIDVVPGINSNMTSVVPLKDMPHHRLVPKEIWSLRGIGRSTRYIAYTRMKWVGNKMIRCELRSSQCQRYWKEITDFSASLLASECDWWATLARVDVQQRVAVFKTVAARRVVAIPVDQEMTERLRIWWERNVQPAKSSLQQASPTPKPVTQMSQPILSTPQLVVEQEQNVDQDQDPEQEQKVEEEATQPPVAPRAPQRPDAVQDAKTDHYMKQAEVIYGANKREIDAICANLGSRKSQPTWRKVWVWQENKNPTAREAAPAPASAPQQPKTDQIDHPLDKIKVPRYPIDDINLYERRTDRHNMYLFRHE
jgi:hypothetical protein